MNPPLPHQGLFSGIEVVGISYLLKVGQNECRTQMSRVYYSLLYRAMYISIIVVSAGCIFYGFLQLGESVADFRCFAIELLICCFLFIDITWRSAICGVTLFFKTWKNLLDLALVAACSVIVVAGFLEGEYSGIASISAMGLAVLRTSAHYVHLVSLLKSMRSPATNVIELNDMSDSQDLASDNRSGLILLRSQDESYSETPAPVALSS